ncbi:MAG TPA: hypothetical protein VMV92_29595 [Streptosporangiaceae bacterium]|nr:hypothetical protein [Streptosporangiaceae bacterium]
MPSLVPLDDVEIAYYERGSAGPGRTLAAALRAARLRPARQDTNREIHLAFLPFLIASKRK